MNRIGRGLGKGRGREREPCSVRTMTEPERAWVGAMIEAEGTVARLVGRITRFGIRVVNSDLEIISALVRATHHSIKCQRVLSEEPNVY